jgi:hypothetical protein
VTANALEADDLFDEEEVDPDDWLLEIEEAPAEELELVEFFVEEETAAIELVADEPEDLFEEEEALAEELVPDEDFDEDERLAEAEELFDEEVYCTEETEGPFADEELAFEFIEPEPLFNGEDFWADVELFELEDEIGLLLSFFAEELELVALFPFEEDFWAEEEEVWFDILFLDELFSAEEAEVDVLLLLEEEEPLADDLFALSEFVLFWSFLHIVLFEFNSYPSSHWSHISIIEHTLQWFIEMHFSLSVNTVLNCTINDIRNIWKICIFENKKDIFFLNNDFFFKVFLPL